MNNICAKQTTIAIVVNHGQFWTGYNKCSRPQTECPRGDMPTGEGYELCKDICRQSFHAEVNACLEAGSQAKGGTLYLIGHTYCCADCIKVMREFGIVKFVIVDNESSVDL